MDDAEAQRQIEQMIKFIEQEAYEKAQEIVVKAEEEFNIQKGKTVQLEKKRIIEDYDKKLKQLEVDKKIKSSKALGAARMKVMDARAKIMDNLNKEVEDVLASISKNKDSYAPLLSSLIVQGLYRLLEDTVMIRCRKEDEAVIKSHQVLEKAAEQYTAKVGKKVNLTLDSKTYLPPAPTGGPIEGKTCAGGVLLLTHGGKIVVDNTLDARLKLVVEDCKPAIRKMLFN
ncbi:unnamed protein product [Vitrella brassicaformis CCMP3155]|uniref:V-type proton ATPase subunit E n=2 Tax=Vitrella brassicaformis TaxID=1169539 RepID=A0A0G4EP60_VITBC|nr:unnamed protein product [Vitrella brassicaformis CCMP3155]|mmetsp:Transcript_4311/g.9836  ORF Transcript_4311/g.9836 Transcript_4311/m.9836 type:complete len:228 (+) Transcript_4311:83-766(+)|eukprot:CEL98593.1 unnamed protein product [Vitrella brassicaformis CCMP3155]